jgi:6-phosphogluconolactonase (cycloisomerase 2 family)
MRRTSPITGLAASRRGFLRISGSALTVGRLSAFQRAFSGERLFAYVGRHTSGFFGTGKGGGITVFRVNMSDGSLTEVSKTGPEFDDLNSDGMCTSADGRFLYSIILTPALGGKPGAGGGVAAFAISREDGTLQHLNTQPSMGASPTSVIIDKTNSRVVVGNHGAVNKIVLINKKNGVPVIEAPTDDATVALFPVRPDGSLEPVCDVSVFAQRPLSDTSGPGAACHSVTFDRTQRWIIASDNGYDHIYVYPFRPDSRKLEGKSFPTPTGKAPRHLVVHPRAPYFFMTNEREASVSSFHFDSDHGDVRPVQTIATVADGYSGPRVAPSNIRMHPNGKFIYSANRGDDSIAIFAIDEGTGRMNRLDVVKTGGQGPREMNIEPSGKFLFVCNLQSNDVVTFALDAATGRMNQIAKTGVPLAAVIDFATR